MIHTTAVPGPSRAGAAAASILGIAVLAGCAAGAVAESAGPTTGETPSSATGSSPSSESSESGSGAATGGVYTDGTYTAEGSYATPESVETISVTVTLEQDVVTSVDVTGDPSKRESEQYQSEFISGIEEVVVGKNLDDISVSRVAGSSLTSGGFNEAIDAIKAEAAA
ncbi:hypothetical protein [Microbacterium sp.]|uniref:hypothetical protein n=1 Tax=Microbacterium sp. TaxID=51671 RepID=UPI003C71BAF1